MVATVLWAGLLVSCVLASIGVMRRSGWALIAAGLLGLGFSWAAILSIGRFIVLAPLLEIALGSGYLLRARRTMLSALAGAAVVLYIAQWAQVWAAGRP